MANDIDKTSPHYKGEFGSIYEVNQKFPNGGVAGDYVEIDGWAHYWNADRGTWCVNAQRDSYWDELLTNLTAALKLMRGASYMGMATPSTQPDDSLVKRFYFAKEAGTYSHFGNISVPQGISILYSSNGKQWILQNLLEISQGLGDSTTKVVSQKTLKDEIGKKADASELAKKANIESVKETIRQINGKFSTQEKEINKKANVDEVNNVVRELRLKDSELEKKLDQKAEQSAVNTGMRQLSSELGKKADKRDVVKTNAAQDAEISRKANQQDVERSLNILRKEIGERTVVEGNVNNNPDEEDLTSKMDSNNREVLSLKDREYNPLEFSGKGYMILRKNIQEVTCAITKIQVTKAPTTDGYVSIIINGVETHVDLLASTDNTVALVAKKIADKLSETMDEYVTSIDGALVTCTSRFGGDVTASSFSSVSTGSEATVSESSKTELRNLLTAAMISEPNTIYEIRYDFDLDGNAIKIPEKCTLRFVGGLIANGEIIYNKTYIDVLNSGIFKNVVVSGTLRNNIAYSDWFCTNKDGINDDSTALQNFLNCSAGKLIVNKGNYHINNTLKLPAYTEVDFSFSTIYPSSNITCLLYEGDYSSRQANIDTTLRNFIIDSKGSDNIVGLQIGRGVYFNYVYNFDIRVYGEESIGILETSNFNAILRDGRIIGRIQGYHDNSIGIKFTTGTDSDFNNQVTNLKTDSVLIQGFEYGCMLDYGTGAHDTIMFSNIGFSSCNIGYYFKSGYTNCIITNQRIENSNLLVKLEQNRALTIIDAYILNTGALEQKGGVCNMLGTIHCIVTSKDNVKNKRAFYIGDRARFNFDASHYTNWGYGLESVFNEKVYRFGKKYISMDAALNNVGITSFENDIPLITDSSYSERQLALNVSANKFRTWNGGTTLVINKGDTCVKLQTSIFSITGGVDGQKILITSNSEDYVQVAFDGRFFIINNDNFILTERVNENWKILSHNAVSFNSTESIGFISGKGLIINKKGTYRDAFDRAGNVAVVGSFNERPAILTEEDKGKEYFDTSLNRPIWWDGNKWIDAQNNTGYKNKGASNVRPNTNKQDEGFVYYDTTLKKLILWNGSDWVNIDGTALT